jgi:hypothetical protein
VVDAKVSLEETKIKIAQRLTEQALWKKKLKTQ